MNGTLSEEQAYLAMFSFLEELYTRFQYDQLGGILGSMCLLPNGTCVDPAIWNDWLRAVERARNSQVDAEMRIGNSTPSRPVT
jgi:hypothetical protein